MDSMVSGRSRKKLKHIGGQAKINKIIIKEGSSIKDALSAINVGAKGICLVINNNGRFLGVVTDGDIRRGLIKGFRISDSITKVVNRKAVFVNEGISKENVLKLFSEKIKHIPVLSKDKKIVDLFSFSQIIHIPIAQPLLGQKELENLTECILTNWISSAGRFIPLFEEKFANYCGVKYAIACSNGTAALHLAMAAMGIKSRDEVIVPALTFIASANSVIYTGAKPILCDSETETWNIDPKKIEHLINKNTKAIMPVHLYGHPCDMESINALAKKYHLLVIEDSAEAIGAEFKGKKTGSLGDIGCFSFYGNKTITTGEGGMVTTNNKDIYEKALILRDHGMSKERKYFHPVIGFNYRMTNMQAAVGVAQMEKIEKLVQRKREIAYLYNKLLKNIESLTLPQQKSWAKNVYWMYSVLINEKSKKSRDEVIAKLKESGIESRPFFTSINLMPPYRGSGKFPVAEDLSLRGINLPSSVVLKNSEVKHISELVRRIFEEA